MKYYTYRHSVEKNYSKIYFKYAKNVIIDGLFSYTKHQTVLQLHTVYDMFLFTSYMAVILITAAHNTYHLGIRINGKFL